MVGRDVFSSVVLGFDLPTIGRVKMELDDKLRIAARLFFEDRMDEYEDYNEALSELTGNVSERFLDHAIEPFVRPQDGYRQLMNDVGHIITVNNETGHVSPVTLQSDEESEALEEAASELAEKHPDLSPVQIMQKVGWRLI
jgi:hypothetical protein